MLFFQGSGRGGGGVVGFLRANHFPTNRCAGFAAFSSAIELYLRMPESDQGGRID